MGNHLVSRELEEIGFKNGRVETAPFSEYDSYIEQISHAACVLIPLAASGFNSAKTPIRLMDAALAGTQVLFSPVGANADIARTLPASLMPVEDEDWAGIGRYAESVIAARGQNVKNLQRAVNLLYGPDAARRTYADLFADQLAIAPTAQQAELELT